MFGMKNQEQTLRKIPLEQFEDVINYINKNVYFKKNINRCIVQFMILKC